MPYFIEKLSTSEKSAIDRPKEKAALSIRRSSLATAPRNAAAIGLRFLSVVLMLLVLLALGVNTAPAQVDQGCATGQAVSDPTNNPGLVADCETLLGLKDEPARHGPAQLECELGDVRLGRHHHYHGGRRAAGHTLLALGDKQLDGTLPAALGDLSSLQSLYTARANQLRGSVPKELGNLANLARANAR